MKKMYRATIFWWPAIFRAVLLSLVTAAGVFIAQSDKLDTETVLKYSWWDWAKFTLPITVALANTVIAFLDQTMGNLRNEETQIWKAGETI